MTNSSRCGFKSADPQPLVTRRAALAGGSAVLLAGSVPRALCAGMATKTSPGWRAVSRGASITINSVRYEAECGPDDVAIQYGARDVVRFTMVPGNGWNEDDPKEVERTELDGWRGALPIKLPVWCSWSLYYEPGPASTSDWCILQQLYQVRGSPIVHVLKPDGNLRWVAEDATHTGGAFPVRHQMKLEQGKWLHFVETYDLDQTVGRGYWKAWVNGMQVLDFKGTIGTKGATHCYPKFGIYRGVQKTWDGTDPKTLNRLVTETISVRYCNMRFGFADLSKLIVSPDPIPEWQQW